MIWRLTGTIVGLVLLIVGIPLMISPIPLGALIIFIGLVILVASNPLAAAFLRKLRKRFPWLNRFLVQAEKVLPTRLAKPLHETEDENGNEPCETGERDDGKAVPKVTLGEPMVRTSVPRKLR